MSQTTLQEISFYDEHPQARHDFSSNVPLSVRLLLFAWVAVIGSTLLMLLVRLIEPESRNFIVFGISATVGVVLSVMVQMGLPKKETTLLLTDIRIVKRTSRSCIVYSSTHYMDLPLERIVASKVEAWKGINPFKFVGSVFGNLTVCIILGVVVNHILGDGYNVDRAFVGSKLSVVVFLVMIPIAVVHSFEKFSRLSLFTDQTLLPASDIAFVRSELATLLSPWRSGAMNVVVNDDEAIELLSVFAQHASAVATSDARRIEAVLAADDAEKAETTEESK